MLNPDSKCVFSALHFEEKSFNRTLDVISCLSLCLASSFSNKESPRDFIDHVLRIPNPDKVLNTVFGRLERKQGLLARQIFNEESLPEYTESLQVSRERSASHLGPQKHYPICHLQRKIHRLNTEDYEYRPAYYEEVRCSPTYLEEMGESNEICSSLGFACVQWNKTIHLTRRPYSSDCWETRTMVIPAGCECMWPVHGLGEMAPHV